MKSVSAIVPFVTRLALIVGSIATIGGCQTAGNGASKPSYEDLSRQLASTQNLVRRYEARYGKLLPGKPGHDFRKLRAQLKGKPMSEVTAVLGKPSAVYTLGPSESWEYSDIAYDSASGRTVRRLEIFFSNGVVDYLKAVF
jgi:hypothetical protein